MALAGEVATHCRRLQRLGLEPGDLGSRVDLTSVLRWAACRVVWLGPPATQRSTYQILIGAIVYFLWVLFLALAVGHGVGPGWGILALALLPPVGITGMWIREHWRGYWSDMRRFFLIRSRARLIHHLQERQRDLADRLDGLVRNWQRRRQQKMEV